MAAQPDRLYMSVSDYLTLDRTSLEARYEFIDGYASRRSGKTNYHCYINVNIIAELSNALRGSSCRVYDASLRVRLSETRYIYPDISVSCDERERGNFDILRYPRFIVEILSPDTEYYDRGKKAGYYRACPTIEEYVLVDSQQPYVEVYRREGDFWKISTFDRDEGDDQVVLENLGISIPFAALYENVRFQEDASDGS